MSWTVAPIKEVTAATATTALASPTIVGVPTPSPQVVEGVEAAAAAAKTIILSGAVGDSEKSFTVYLSGHANAEHEPTEGWANDCITVTVTQE